MAKITFVMDDNTKSKLDKIRSKENDNRSIQKELEWLIHDRYSTLFTQGTVDSTHNTVSKPDDFTEEEQRIINEVKKNTPQKSKMVQSFMKGGK
jgi:hypothetical protein